MFNFITESNNLFSSQPSQENEVLQLFKSWDMTEEIISNLNDRGINSEIVLLNMEMEDIDYLFDKLDTKFFGEKIKFKAGLRAWRKQMVRYSL